MRGSLWVRVVKSIHGDYEGLGDVRAIGGGVTRGGVWEDIVRVGGEIDGLGVEFAFLFWVLRNGRDIRFWVDWDRWRWTLGEDGEFTVKELSRLIYEKNPTFG
ncbi:hypothetical protein Tco_1142320 [Tanacetum coccineum]